MIVDEIAEYLEDQGVGTVGDDIFVGAQPTDPILCTIVKDTGGLPPDKYVPIKNPTCQIIARATTYLAAKNLVQASYDALVKKENFNLPNSDGSDDDGGTYIYWIEALQEPAEIGRDKNDNWEFSCNFRLITR